MATKLTAPKFTTGQAVEVRVFDFTAPGQPLVWVAGSVTAVERREDGKFDVMVRRVDGHLFPAIVGVRGGNARMRAL